MIHYISPYSTTKNIGGAINSNISNLNIHDADWIVHTDQDICFLRPDTKAQIREVLRTTNYHVLGCVTNRLASTHQLHENRFNDSSDIREHMLIADQRHKDYYGLVEPTSKNIAACLMAFRVKTWREVGSFKENSIQFDSDFTRKVQVYGGKLGIMKGVYIFHLYRMWSKNPRLDIKHLV